MVRTESVPGPADSVTPLADHVADPAVASTKVLPPSALTWIFSPAPNVLVNVPLTVCAATLVMKSVLELPSPHLTATAAAAACGPSATTLFLSPVAAPVLP